MGALGNGIDQVNDLRNFLGTLAETLDAFFHFGNGFADRVHPDQGSLHGFHRAFGGLGGFCRRTV